MSIARDLFDLIKSLTPSEKGNFKKAVTQKKDEQTNYYKLYVAFLKLEEYCPEILEKKYKKEPSTKENNDLFLKLFNNLRSSSKVKSPQLLIREKLQNSEILYARDIYEKSFKELEKVKKDAYKIEDFPVILEIIDKQRYVQRYLKIDTKNQLALQGEYDQTLAILNLKNKLDNLWEQYLIIKESTGVRKMAELNKLKEEVISIDYNTVTSYASSLLKIRYNYLLANILLFTENPDKALEYSQLVLEEYNKKTTLKHANEEVYSNHLLGYFNCFINTNSAILIDKRLIKEFEAILNKNVTRSATNFENLYMFLSTYYLNTGNFEGFKTLVIPIEAGLKKFKHKIKLEYHRVFIINMSSFYFISEDFEQCRVWLNKQIYLPRNQPSMEKIAMSKLLDCIVSLEIDEIEDIDNALRRLTDYVRKVDYQNPFLADTIVFLKGYIPKFQRERVALAEEFNKEIKDKRKATSTYDRQQFFEETVLWLQSKQTKRKIFECCKDLFK